MARLDFSGRRAVICAAIRSMDNLLRNHDPKSRHLTAMQHHEAIKAWHRGNFDIPLAEYIFERLNVLFPPDPTLRQRLRDWWDSCDYVAPKLLLIEGMKTIWIIGIALGAALYFLLSFAMSVGV